MGDMHGTPQTPQAPEAHAVIFTGGSSASPEWRFRFGSRERTVALTPRLMVDQVAAALFAAREGHGIARALSYQVDDDIKAGRLVRLLEPFETPPLPVQLIIPSTRLMPMRVRRFLDFAIERLRRRPILTESGCLRRVQPRIPCGWMKAIKRTRSCTKFARGCTESGFTLTARTSDP
jgi:DNA-binding transcriptional LysR family regulator